MKLEMYIQNSNDGTVYDVTEVAEQTTVTQNIDGTAGKLTCILQKDPNNLLKLANGSIVSFHVNGVGFFFGYIFSIGTDMNENYQITAYDSLRYLKNSDIYNFEKGTTASGIFEKICKDYSIKYKVNVPTNYKPEPYQFTNKTLYSMIKRGMDLASINDKKRYFITDNFGTLTWDELSANKTNIQLGDGSLLTSYTYETSIDTDTYNQIKLYSETKKENKIDVWIVKDTNNIKRWGVLQLLKQVDDTLNSSQVRQMAEDLLSVKNRQTETLKLTGDGILELVCGKGVKVVIGREGIDKWLWITSSTHTFTKNSHTMDLEVEL